MTTQELKAKIEASRNEIRTNLKLEGTEEQIYYAQRLIKNTFGEDLMKLERLRKDCKRLANIPDFPNHKILLERESQWEQIRDCKKAGDVIGILKTY